MQPQRIRTDDELPRTLQAERPPEPQSPVPGPGPAPMPERLPGDLPEPERSPAETPPPIYARSDDDGEERFTALNALEQRAIGAWRGPSTGQSVTLPIGSSLFDIERAFIVATLLHFDGDKRRTASALGCSVKTLYNKLHLYRRQLGHVAAVS